MKKSKMILKEFDKNYAKLKIQKNNKVELKSDLFNRQWEAMEEIKRYIDSYQWVTEEKVKEKLKFIRDSNYDYELVRQRFNMSSNALKCFVYQNSKKLEQKIGSDTISSVLSSYDEKVKHGLTTFRVLSGIYTVEEILLKECYAILPKGEDFSFFNLKDCIAEINFLYTYSKIGLEFAFDELNPKILNFLYYIMTHEVKKYQELQKDLLMVLQGINIDIDEFIERIKIGYYDDFA